MTLFFVSHEPYGFFFRRRDRARLADDTRRPSASGDDLSPEALHEKIESAIRAGRIWDALKFEFQLDLDLLLAAAFEPQSQWRARTDRPRPASLHAGSPSRLRVTATISRRPRSSPNPDRAAAGQRAPLPSALSSP